MAKKYFGTDGVRGTANKEKITADLMLKIGQAAGIKFQRGDHKHRVLIGKDTRLSGYMIENALTAGFVSMGMDVILVGPVPTPAVAMLIKSMRADLGVMISASHNKYQDNGIKFFDHEGYKLSDDIEHEIEELLEKDLSKHLATSDKIGKATRIEDASGRYIEYIKNTFPRNKTLEGFKIVIDCANGSAYKVGPTILWELGAEVVTIGASPNGFNINENCGSTHPETLAKAVVKNKADIGLALDGDADRLVICDSKGNVIDGDQVIALIANYMRKKNSLKGGGVVTTKMSNLGLEQYLETLKLKLKRTDVGDRYVSEYMRKHGFNLGGEQSGHIILGDFSTTGDGLMAALQVLAALSEYGSDFNKAFAACFKPLPQVTRNVALTKVIDLNNAELVNIIKEIEEKLGSDGRVLVRKSGTEPLIRVMIEGKKLNEINRYADRIANKITDMGGETTSQKLIHNVFKNISNIGIRFKRWGRTSS